MFRTENEKPFWLDTPNSTNEGYSSSCVQFVYSGGDVAAAIAIGAIMGFVRFAL